MVDLVLTRDGEAYAAVTPANLDLAYGDDENDYELVLPDGLDALPAQGDIWMMDGTPYGGVVDSIQVDSGSTSTVITYTGRSLQGILAAKILEPDTGQDYLNVSGNITSVLTQIIDRCDLAGLFVAEPGRSQNVSGRFERYTDAYSGLRHLFASYSMGILFTCVDDRVRVDAQPLADTNGDVDSNLFDFTAKREYRRTNHLIGLGEGELKNRTVVHYYADADGNVSKTQTLFGVDEVAAVYDYNNADDDELDEKTREELESRQEGTGSIDVTVLDGADYEVGDLLSANDVTTGLQVRASITKKIVKVENGVLSVDYEAGQAEYSNGGRSESSGSSGSGGVSYVAGEGIDISGNTISADVTESDLDAVRTVASEANATASNLSASVGAARQEAADALSAAEQARDVADAATGAAATAQSTAESRVESVAASAPLTVSRSGSTVALGVTMASQTAAGVMSAGDKAKLDGIEDNANAYTLPVATVSRLGGVKPDGTTITISGDGVITAQPSEAAVSFLAAHPVGSIFMAVGDWFDPGSRYGGSWVELPSLGGFLWKRTA